MLIDSTCEQKQFEFPGVRVIIDVGCRHFDDDVFAGVAVSRNEFGVVWHKMCLIRVSCGDTSPSGSIKAYLLKSISSSSCLHCRIDCI